MSVAREFMHTGCECIGENESLEQAARKMRELDVGSLPICGEDQRLHGMITDRDIVIKCLAMGGDPRSTKAGDLAEGKPVTIGADESIEHAMELMERHQIRRLPVIDESHNLVGMLSQGDLARHCQEAQIGEVVHAISR